MTLAGDMTPICIEEYLFIMPYDQFVDGFSNTRDWLAVMVKRTIDIKDKCIIQITGLSSVFNWLFFYKIRRVSHSFGWLSLTATIYSH